MAMSVGDAEKTGISTPQHVLGTLPYFLLVKQLFEENVCRAELVGLSNSLADLARVQRNRTDWPIYPGLSIQHYSWE